MKWSINQLQRYRQGDMPIDEMVNLDSVKKRHEEIREIAPIHVTGSCKIGTSELTCRFRLEGTMTLPCARTWEDVKFPFVIESVERFSLDGVAIETEDEIRQIDGDFVDLTPVFEELILLEIPLQIYSEAAENVNRIDGKGWSYSTDEIYKARLQEEKESKVDPRLAALANLFDKKDE